MRTIVPGLLLAAMTGLSAATVADVPRGEANVPDLAVGDTIPVTVIPRGVHLRVDNDPVDDLWERVPEYQVWLMPAPIWHPSVGLRQEAGGKGMPLYFSAASDGTRLYVKLRWVDSTADRVTSLDRFRDGAAVQFALKAADVTPYLMGVAGAPVNIWYWKADDDSAENLAAGGPGSTTRLDDQPLGAASAHGKAAFAPENQWVVVMSRALGSGGMHMADLDPSGDPQPVAFAVWQGAGGERDGHKNASTGWIFLDLSPLASG